MIYLFPLMIVAMMIVSLIGFSNPGFIASWIKFNNQIKGVKSEITPVTINMARIGCIFLLVMGIFMLYFFFTNFLPTYQSVHQTINQNSTLTP